MKAKLVKPSSFIQVILDMYMYHIVINKSCKRSFITNPKTKIAISNNINFA